MNAVDTNVLVYFVDNDEPAKRAEAVRLLDDLLNEESLGRELSLLPRRRLPGCV